MNENDHESDNEGNNLHKTLKHIGNMQGNPVYN